MSTITKTRRPTARLFPLARRDGVGAILRIEEFQTQITALAYGRETVHFLALELELTDPRPTSKYHAPHVLRFIFRFTAEGSGDGSCCAVYYDWQRMEGIKHFWHCADWIMPLLTERELRWLIQFQTCPAPLP